MLIGIANILEGTQAQQVGIEVGQVGEALVAVDFNYEEGENGPFVPVLRNVVIDGLKSQKSKRALDLRGLKKEPITGFF